MCTFIKSPGEAGTTSHDLTLRTTAVGSVWGDDVKAGKTSLPNSTSSQGLPSQVYKTVMFF